MSDYEVFYSADGSTVVDIDDIQTNSAGSVEAYYSPNGSDLFQFWPQETLIDDFEYSTSEFFNRYTTPSGTQNKGTTSSAALVPASTRGHFMDGSVTTTANWAVPSAGTLEHYPEPGYTTVFHYRPMAFGGQVWLLFGGVKDINDERYEFQHIPGSNTVRIQCNPEGGSKFNVAQEDNSPYSMSTGQTKSIACSWFSQSLDGRTGVALRIYDGVLPDLDNDSPEYYVDSAGRPDDGSNDIPQEEGKVGYRSSMDGDVYVDWVLKERNPDSF